jgi:tetratricopeptide (TPR) repeat protein
MERKCIKARFSQGNQPDISIAMRNPSNDNCRVRNYCSLELARRLKVTFMLPYNLQGRFRSNKLCLILFLGAVSSSVGFLPSVLFAQLSIGTREPMVQELIGTGHQAGERIASSSAKGGSSIPLGTASDLEMIYGKTETATTSADYTSIYDFCRNISGDSMRSAEDRRYARNLMSWAANRRGEVRSDQAGALAQSQNFSEAERMDALAKKDFETSISLDATRWRAHHNLGIIHAVQGNHQSALDSFTNVIKLNPEYTNAYHNRAEIYSRTKRFTEALADFNQLVQLNGNDSAAYTSRAHALFASGKTSEALSDYRKAMELAPDSAEATTNYADTCQALGQWKEAAAAYQVAMKLDGSNAKTLQNAAWMMATCPDEYYRNGDAALQTASKAIQFASSTDQAQVLDVLAAAQAAAGDYEAARGTVTEALQMVTDPSLRSEMQMRAKLYARKKAFVQPRR